MIGIATKIRKAVVSRSSGRSGYSTDRFTGYAGGGGGGGIAIVLLPSRLIHGIPRLRVVFRKRSCDGCPTRTMHGRPRRSQEARAGDDETEFFIRKAIGWVLRETSKTRPDEVYRWIVPRTHRASGVTMRETVKYLDATWAERLMRAYREGRTAQAVR
ncbi:MAG: hypothetical protein E6G43_11470 [Actinobacteria bacterium]|nr:MAG: hypothetical protein E6G43_11470 [Actinomycetota bacterium]